MDDETRIEDEREAILVVLIVLIVNVVVNVWNLVDADVGERFIVAMVSPWTHARPRASSGKTCPR